MSKTKKSTFAKLWILVAIVSFAWIMVLLVPWALEWGYYSSDYDNIVQYLWSTLTLNLRMTDTLVFWGSLAIAIANGLMVIVWLVRKLKSQPSAPMNPVEPVAPAAPISIPVSIPSGEREQTVLERHCYSAFPIVLMVLGVIAVSFGIISITNYAEEIGIPLLVIGAAVIAVSALLSKKLTIHLVVTTKRVYLKAPFASRINLPLGRISAVSTGLFHLLTITSAAGLTGQIRLIFVPKYLEVYDTINALLNEME